MVMWILALIILIVLVAIPLVFTIINTINLFAKEPKKDIDVATMVVGLILTLIAASTIGDGDYHEELYDLSNSFYGGPEMYNFIASWHLPTIFALTTVAMVGFFILKYKKTELSPIASALCISSCYIGNILGLLFSIQLSSQVSISFLGVICVCLILFPLNYFLCSARMIKNVIACQINKIKDYDYTNKSLLLERFRSLLTASLSWYIAAFVLMLPLLALLICVLMLFGQKPDAAIKAFTETSEWTLSQMIPPPRIQYSGHYLCTVALMGDARIVRPTRVGVRHGVRIVVNRQLCVANAFEQRIEELFPKIHLVIRCFYDRHGYPLSKHITTKERANIVYILMKPLEWFFVFFLYLADQNPENRIAMQYINRNT